jgi:hypothetical protein
MDTVMRPSGKLLVKTIGKRRLDAPGQAEYETCPTPSGSVTSRAQLRPPAGHLPQE